MPVGFYNAAMFVARGVRSIGSFLGPYDRRPNHAASSTSGTLSGWPISSTTSSERLCSTAATQFHRLPKSSSLALSAAHISIIATTFSASSSGTWIPQMNLLHWGNTQFALPFYCSQFPIAPAFAITVNKSQGQILDQVCVFLPTPAFTHGQLYVALSRLTDQSKVVVCFSKPTLEETMINVICQ